MDKIMAVSKAIIVCCLFFAGTHAVFAGGYEIAEQTARSIALNNAITAGIDDPSALYVNPAALTEVSGNQIMQGANFINTMSRVKNGGRNSRNLHDDDFLPNLFAVKSIISIENL